MSNILPAPGSSLTRQVPDGFSRNESKELARRQNAELTHGLVKATRVQAAALVATVGVQTTAMLSREANFQSDGDPATIQRLNHIVDQYACLVGNEIARFGF